MSYRTDVEGLRALAVLPIVLFHFGSTWLSGGYVGVDVFFVISGFVIARSIVAEVDAGRFGIAAFYFRRMCRILPALIALVVATSAVAVLLLLPEDLETHFRSVASVGAFASNIFFWKSSGYFEAAAQTRPLLHTWSLAVEEQYYLLAPALLAFLYRRARRWWLPAILVVAAASLAVSVATVFVAPKAGYFLLPSRAWELLLGAAIALASATPFARPVAREGLALGGVALILGSVVLLDESSPFPGWNALFPCLGTVMVILVGTGAGRLPVVNRLLSTAAPRWIGRISYSLYLVHWPVVAFFHYRMLRPPTAAEGAVMVVASVAVAALSWRFVEEPARRWAHRMPADPARRRRVLSAGVVASLATIALGLGGAATGGWPGRFPDYHRVAVAGQEQWGGPACFNEDPSRVIAWDAGRCTRVHGRGGRVLLWGDSNAAHYVPGLVARARLLDRDVLQYTFAGCPPILGYYSAARIGCARSNARVPGMIRALGIEHVVLAARWDGVALRQIAQLHDTIATLRRAGVRVTVIGQSPLFGASPQTIDYLSGQSPHRVGSSAPMVNAAVVEAVRREAADATFVDPLARLCHGGRCPYRVGRHWYYADEGHLSAAGSTWAADLFLIAALTLRAR